MFSRELAARKESSVQTLKSVVMTMPGRGKQVNSTAKNITLDVYKYFEREIAKTKYTGPPRLTRKTAEATNIASEP